eukprot:scaffold425_cov175-Amphora_coffeaeformis.AAC.10
MTSLSPTYGTTTDASAPVRAMFTGTFLFAETGAREMLMLKGKNKQNEKRESKTGKVERRRSNRIEIGSRVTSRRNIVDLRPVDKIISRTTLRRHHYSYGSNIGWKDGMLRYFCGANERGQPSSNNAMFGDDSENRQNTDTTKSFRGSAEPFSCRLPREKSYRGRQKHNRGVVSKHLERKQHSNMALDIAALDGHIERLRKGETLTENEVRALCEKVRHNALGLWREARRDRGEMSPA